MSAGSLFNGSLDIIRHVLELQSFSSLLCAQSLRLQKYFELQEDRLKDLLRREKLWGKEKKEDELPKMAVS